MNKDAKEFNDPQRTGNRLRAGSLRAGSVSSLASSVVQSSIMSDSGLRQWRAWSRFKPLAGSAFRGFLPMIGPIATVIGLLFLFRPEWKPPEPAQSAAGIISAVAIEETQILWEDFMRMLDRTCEGYYTSEDEVERCNELSRTYGNTISVEISLTGAEGDRPYLLWHMYDAETRQRIDNSFTQNQRAFDVEMKTKHMGFNERIFVPCYGHTLPVFIKVEAFDESGTRLDFETSEPFSDAC